MTSVSNQDLSDLLMILYTASVKKNKLAVIPAINDGISYFAFESIPILADEYNLPLPLADLYTTLKVGLTRGIFNRSIQNGTQCGFNPCNGKGASYLLFPSSGNNANSNLDLNTDINSSPVLIYAYNPNMIKVNHNNVQLLNNTCVGYQKVSGSFVKYSNNRAPCYQYRGSASTSNYPYVNNRPVLSNRCCRK
jgi:hypothetical protein